MNIVIPRIDHNERVISLAPAPFAVREAVIGVLDNGKPFSDVLLPAIAQNLIELGVGKSYFVIRKAAGAAFPVSESERSEMLARAHMVVTGVGDCGGCTACSVTDALEFEENGLPATVVITEVFKAVASNLAAAMGAPGYHSLTTEHPIFGRSPEWMNDAAKKAALTARDHLLLGGDICRPEP